MKKKNILVIVTKFKIQITIQLYTVPIDPITQTDHSTIKEWHRKKQQSTILHWKKLYHFLICKKICIVSEKRKKQNIKFKITIQSHRQPTIILNYKIIEKKGNIHL